MNKASPFEINNTLFSNPISLVFILICFSLVVGSCEPFVDKIEESRNSELYYNYSNGDVSTKDTILIMTWNIRFGCSSQILWFGDACGNRTVLKRSEVTTNLDLIIQAINSIKPDILLLQEVDLPSKRTAYIDQMKYIIDRSYFRYGAYATNWKAQYIPSDGIGRLDEGNAVLSRWPIVQSRLEPLPLRGDIDALTKYFYVRETVMTCRISSPGMEFNVVNTHLSAFSTDDTKRRQLERYIEILHELDATGIPLITGGDYNLLPPNSDSLDYCDEDKCSNESFHQPDSDPMHKEGSNYAPEITWLTPLYDSFQPSLSLSQYKTDQNKYFTHVTDPNVAWDRTLDYLFSNRPWIPLSHTTYQQLRRHSDHAPVSALVRVR